MNESELHPVAGIKSAHKVLIRLPDAPLWYDGEGRCYMDGWAAALGLTEDWQVELFKRLSETAAERGIPLEDVPALARNLDKVDFGALLMDPGEVTETLGIGYSNLDNMIARDPEWMIPTVWAKDEETGRTKIRLWLKTKIMSYKKYRDESDDPRLIELRRRKAET